MNNAVTRFLRAIVVFGSTAAALIGLAVPVSAQRGVPNIHYGSRGWGVYCVQAALNYADHAGLTLDGVDGPKTTKAIRTFQAKYGHAVDGIVGPHTGNDVYYFDYYHYSDNCYDYVPTTY